MEQIILNINFSKYTNMYMNNQRYWQFYFNDFILFKGINCYFCGNFIRLQNLNIKKYPENIYCKCFINEWFCNYKDIHKHYFQEVMEEYMNIIKSRNKLIKYALFYKIKENKYEYKKDFIIASNMPVSPSSLSSSSVSSSSDDLENYDPNDDNFKLNIILNSLIKNSVEDFFKKI